MLFCEQCRQNNNWPDGLTKHNKCEQCGKHGVCYDVPSVMLVPEADRTTEQKMVLNLVMESYREKADRIVITGLDGRVNNRMTTMVREIYVTRNEQVDWYATFLARLTVQEKIQQHERHERDRSQ